MQVRRYERAYVYQEVKEEENNDRKNTNQNDHKNITTMVIVIVTKYTINVMKYIPHVT